MTYISARIDTVINNEIDSLYIIACGNDNLHDDDPTRYPPPKRWATRYLGISYEHNLNAQYRLITLVDRAENLTRFFGVADNFDLESFIT